MIFQVSMVHISKNNTWCQVRPERLAHLAYQTSIANQDTKSIWHCVLILPHLTSCALVQSWHRPLRPLRPDGAWCSALAPWIYLILGCCFRATPDDPPLHHDHVWSWCLLFWRPICIFRVRASLILSPRIRIACSWALLSWYPPLMASGSRSSLRAL